MWQELSDGSGYHLLSHIWAEVLPEHSRDQGIKWHLLSDCCRRFAADWRTCTWEATMDVVVPRFSERLFGGNHIYKLIKSPLLSFNAWSWSTRRKVHFPLSSFKFDSADNAHIVVRIHNSLKWDLKMLNWSTVERKYRSRNPGVSFETVSKSGMDLWA
jgi:hypothetical protein